MNKLKIILIISGIILGMGTLANVASAAGLSVKFENSPLFNNVNFGPGDSVTKWVKVDNTSGSTQKIITEAINKNDSDNFSEKLNLTIKEGGTEIFNNTLKMFFDQGETYLSNLTSNGNTQYDFTITFNADANDDWQGKTLSFDIVVGFQGQEGQSSGGGTSGSPSGGGNPGIPALSIYNEANAIPTETSVTITWTTSYAATSQVIYGAENESHVLDLSDNTGIPPLYGYAHTTPEYDTTTRVVYHSVTITGLAPGTTYYYRAVSHGSLAIGRELTFTTTGSKLTTEETGGEVAGAFTERPEQIAQTDINTETENEVTTEEPVVEEQATEPEIIQTVSTEKPSLFASIFSFSTFGRSVRTIAIIVVIALLIYWLISALAKKNKKKNPENPNLKNGQWK